MGFFDMLLVLRFRLDTTWITSKTILPLRVLCPETASSTLWMLGFLNYPSTFQQILHCAFICVWHKCQRVRHCTFLLLVSEPLHIRSWCYVPYLLKQRPTLHHLSLFDAVSKQFLVPRSFMSKKKSNTLLVLSRFVLQQLPMCPSLDGINEHVPFPTTSSVETSVRHPRKAKHWKCCWQQICNSRPASPGGR